MAALSRHCSAMATVLASYEKHPMQNVEEIKIIKSKDSHHRVHREQKVNCEAREAPLGDRGKAEKIKT